LPTERGKVSGANCIPQDASARRREARRVRDRQQVSGVTGGFLGESPRKPRKRIGHAGKGL
jgi:hypothetical protein